MDNGQKSIIKKCQLVANTSILVLDFTSKKKMESAFEY